MTGELAVCAGSCGPDNLHLINGLYDAHRSGAPVVAIASQIPTVQIGSEYFQETHPDRLFIECSSYCELVSTARQAPHVVAAPLGHSLRGKEWIQYDNPFDVGMTGLLGYGAAHDGIHDADLLIPLSTDFPYSQFLPDAADVTIAQVDRRPERLGRRARMHVPVCGDVRATIAAVTPLMVRKSDPRFLEKTLTRHNKLLDSVVGAYTKNVEQLTPIHPEYAASILDDVAADDAIFTAGTGMCNVWTARRVRAFRTRTCRPCHRPACALAASDGHGRPAERICSRDVRGAVPLVTCAK